MGAAGVLPGHDRPAELPLGSIVIKRDHRVVAVGDDPVPLPVKRREGHLRGSLQARGLRLLLAGLVDHAGRSVPALACPVQPFRGGLLLPPQTPPRPPPTAPPPLLPP